MAFRGEKEINQANCEKLKEALAWLQDFVTPTGYAAGTGSPTVADLACFSSYTTIAATGTNYVNVSEFKGLTDWAEKIKASLPDYEKANGSGVEEFREMFKQRTGLQS